MSLAPALHDRYGLPLSTSSATAVERYMDGIDRLLSLNADAEVSLAQAVEADQCFALAHAALAFFWQGQGRTEDAKAGAARTRSLAGGISRRERRHVEAIAAAVDGEAARALGLIREHLAEFPRDALMVQQATGLISASGRQDRQQERFALLAGLAPAYGDDWWFLSTYAFAHHELDLLDQSRRLSERSLAQYPRNAGASHNIAHVQYETDDHAGGVDFLGAWLADYDQRAPYHCHLSWHLALFELASGHYRRVMELYERAICPAVAQTRLAFVDASSLLWRYQLYGCTREPLPWQDVCALAARIAPRPGVAFSDAHAALAYAAAGDEEAISRLLDGLRALDAKGHPLAGSVLLPLAQGVAAFARGAYDEAVRLMEPLAGQLGRIGGSHAQWQVFEDTLLEAYLRSGRFEQAETLLRRRLDRRPSARDFFWLGRAQAGRGRAEAATVNLREAQARWRHADPDSPELEAMGHALSAIPGQP